MRILQATSWVSRQGGGVPPVVKGLARAEMAEGHEVHVVGLDDPYAREDTDPWNVPVHLGRVQGPSMLGFSSELRQFFTRSRGSFDLAHYHGLWMWPGYLTRRFARIDGIPLIISPHGMVDPWALSRSRWKKRIAGLLFEDANMRSAACFHALSASEYESIRAIGMRNPVAIVPNGIELADYAHLPTGEVLADRIPELRGRRTALFLSRIHPKKGLPHLIKAWASLRSEYEDWTLLVVGPDQVGHTAAMKGLAKELGIERSVCFAGPLYGQDKFVAMTGSDFFILPSFSEGFSMAVLEAAACGLPLVLTPQCNFPELVAAGGAIEIEPTQSQTDLGLRKLMSLSDAERDAMGQRAKRFVQEKYTWPKIAKDMLEVYEWALGAGPKPASVRLD